jgi:hypothetical protein
MSGAAAGQIPRNGVSPVCSHFAARYGRAFSSEVVTGSREENRQNKEIDRA